MRYNTAHLGSSSVEDRYVASGTSVELALKKSFQCEKTYSLEVQVVTFKT